MKKTDFVYLAALAIVIFFAYTEDAHSAIRAGYAFYLIIAGIVCLFALLELVIMSLPNKTFARKGQ